MTLNTTYRQLKDTLAKAPNAAEDPGFEASLLLEAVMGITREMLLRDGGREVLATEAEALNALVIRRKSGEPLQYLLGEWEFYGLPFAVGPGVLIPRPETELLVDEALRAVEGLATPMLLDLCSGSGCIPIAVAKNRPDAGVWGVELSEDAYSYFKKNIELNLAQNVTPVHGNALELPLEILSRQWHVITSNPPYIASGQLSGLQAEVQQEPAMALDGGPDGLMFYRRLSTLCLPLLADGGLLAFEIGEDQGEAVKALLIQAGFVQISIKKDYAGHHRVVTGIKPI